MIKVCAFSAVAILLLSGCREMPHHEPYPIHVGFLRGEHIKDLIGEMDESQWAGDAESAFKGGDSLFDKLSAQAVEAYPDGEYVAHIGIEAKPVVGFKHHSMTEWGRYWRQVYRKH